MYDFSSQTNVVIQGLLGIIILGVFTNIWNSTKAYGGIIGGAIRFLGFGMLFMSISVLERILINFQIIAISPNLSLAQDILSLLGLALLGIGFSRLAAATKA